MRTLAAVAAVLALVAGLGLIWYLFMAAEARRHRAERDELELRNREAHQAAERAMLAARRDGSTVN